MLLMHTYLNNVNNCNTILYHKTGVALGIAFAYGWQLTLITLAFVPLMIIAGFIMMKLLTGQVGIIA